MQDAVPGASLSDRESTAGRDGGRIFSVWNGDQSGIWYGDGTLSGSHRVATVGAREFIGAANGFVFPAWDPAGPQGEPWWSDGTPEGTYLLRDIRPGDAASAPRHLTDFNGALLFSADEPDHGRELWRSDGSEDRTELVMDIRPGTAGSEPAEIVRLGDAVFFAADDGVHGRELWRSDGTAAGTSLLLDILPGATGAQPQRLSVVDHHLYFFADDGTHGIELWTTDGTAEGTVLVADVNPSGDACEWYDDRVCILWGRQNRDIAGVGGWIYFPADDGVHGVELWRSSGPGGRVELVADLFAGSDSSWPLNLLAFEDTLYFNVDQDGRRNDALWRIGDEEAIAPLQLPPLRFNNAAHRIGDEVVALAEDLSGGAALWRADAFGHQELTVVPFYYEESSQTPVGAGGSIFLAGYAGLWRSDVGVLESDDYMTGGPFTSLYNVAGKLLFAGRDRWYDNITELWTADGLPWGTRRLQYIPPTEHSYSASRDVDEPTFVVSGDHVFFAADSGGTGAELWALPLDVLPEVQPIPEPTATPTAEEVATPTPTPSVEATATPRPTCPLSGDPPGCARLEVRDVAVAAGESATVAVVLRARGEAVASVQVVLRFDSRLRLARNANGAPQCTVNDAIHKEATVFALSPGTCGDNGAACLTVRALVFSVANLDAIADGATLFTCRVDIPDDATAGAYSVTASEVLAASPDGVGFAIGVRDGMVNVAGRTERAERNLETVTTSSGSCSIQRQLAAGLRHLAAGLFVIALLRMRRRHP